MLNLQQVGRSAKPPVSFSGKKESDDLLRPLSVNDAGKDTYGGKKGGKTKKLAMLAALAVVAAVVVKKGGLGSITGLLNKVRGKGADVSQQAADTVKQTVDKTV
jgi:hypothetical protein